MPKIATGADCRSNEACLQKHIHENETSQQETYLACHGQDVNGQQDGEEDGIRQASDAEVRSPDAKDVENVILAFLVVVHVHSPNCNSKILSRLVGPLYDVSDIFHTHYDANVFAYQSKYIRTLVYHESKV